MEGNSNKGKFFNKTFLKYVFSAGTSFLLDLGLFQLFVILLKDSMPDTYILVSTIIARIISSVYNFFMNRKVVFKSEGKVGKDMLKYYILSISQMLASSVSVHFLSMAIDTYEIFIKLPVDIVLFLISYNIQKKYIFKRHL